MAKVPIKIGDVLKANGKRPKTASESRPSSCKRGYGRPWRKAAKEFLRQPGNRLCVQCGAIGQHVPATIVDHIVPHRDDQALFWDERNWQPLCRPHHDLKTLREDVGALSFRAVICGKPGSGKTSFLDSVQRPGDLAIDLDRLAGLLTLQPRHPRPNHVAELLVALRGWLCGYVTENGWPGSVWVIVADASAARVVAREIGGRVIDLDPRPNWRSS